MTGFYPKYVVRKIVGEMGGELVVGEQLTDVFVLRPEKDHAARMALAAYAKATTNKALATDLLTWLVAVGEDNDG